MKVFFSDAWKMMKQSIDDFISNRVFKLSAALAYYTLFSLPAMLIIIISVSDLLFRREVIEGSLIHQIGGLVGQQAALQVQETLRTAFLSGNSRFATVVGIITLIIGATSVFSEIQDSINLIWKLKAKPKKGKGAGIIKLLINRLLSFSVVVSLGFLLMVSLIVNSVMDLLVNHLLQRFPEVTVVVVYIINFLLTFLIITLLFGIIFKVLPDARIQWKHIRVGAITTAILFMLGKFLISYYLGKSRLSSSYGAAGSVILILLWVYYSAVILYFGAVFTRVYVIHRGSRIYPNDYAVWIQEIEVESELSLQQQPDHKRVIEPRNDR